MKEVKGVNILNFVKELPNDDVCKTSLFKIELRDGFKCSKY